jgi:cytochrome c peroxidase
MNRKLVRTGLVAILVLNQTAIALTQTPRATLLDRARNKHLVGHEDAALIARIDAAIAEWDPRNLDSPYLITHQIPGGPKYSIRRPDLAEFIQDADAAVALGKMLFWEMQAGSDYGSSKEVDGKQVVYGTACASCHYRFGADARDKNTDAIAYQAWDKFQNGRPGLDPAPVPDEEVIRPPFTQRALPFQANKTVDPAWFTKGDPGLLQHQVIGSQGIELKRFTGLEATTGFDQGEPIGLPDPAGVHLRQDMFAAPAQQRRLRQVTARNSPTVINSVFYDRQFHDGRAESTFNGFSVFGDFDQRVVLRKATLQPDGTTRSVQAAHVAIPNASLGSQAVGPIVNEVEMSFQGRTFHDLAVKLLRAQPLMSQQVSPTDSVLGPYASVDPAAGLHDPQTKQKLNYRELIKKAFRQEWWAEDARVSKTLEVAINGARTRFDAALAKLPADDPLVVEIKSTIDATRHFPAARVLAILDEQLNFEDLADEEIARLYDATFRWYEVEGQVLPLRTAVSSQMNPDRMEIDEVLAEMSAGGPDGLTAKDDLMVNNFSLYWGLSIMLYESTLISNDTPFDRMLRGDASGVQALSKLINLDVVKVSATDPRATDPPEPLTDDEIRRVQLDKLQNLNAPPTLDAVGMFQRGMRVFVANCAECHAPPFFTSAANLELAPEIPAPIAELHGESLLPPSQAGSFQMKLLASGKRENLGVQDADRANLGGRDFFFDFERIPAVEAAVMPLMIELMGIPDARPVSFNVGAPPGGIPPDRVPMITWTGTRPPLEFAPSPGPVNQRLRPHAFYDAGFYNLGVSEPRFDWGIWGFAASDFSLSFDPALMEAARALAESTPGAAGSQRALIGPRLTPEMMLSIPSLGSAYVMPRRTPIRRPQIASTAIRAALAPAEDGGLAESPQSEAVQPDAAADEDLRAEMIRQIAGIQPADHSAERNFLGLIFGQQRRDVHFFSRTRRMVMSEETWGHRKPFISDNELVGWGAFKSPTLRNIALTEPYMHNGRFKTLRQVLDFYSFDNPTLIPAHPTFNPDLHPDMGRLALNDDGLIEGLPDGIGLAGIVQIQDAESLLFFMHCLTDERVRKESGPFDHPSIALVNGHADDLTDNVFIVKETGIEGTAEELPTFPAAK